MRNRDAIRMRSCDRSQAPPGWYLRCVAVVQARPGMCFDRPHHGHHTIECVLEGAGTVRVGDRHQRCTAGDSYLLPEGVGHRIEAAHTDPWRKIFLDLRGPLIGHLLNAYGLEERIFPNCDCAPILRRLLDHIGDDRSLQLAAGEAVQRIIACWHASVQPPPEWPAVVSHAKEYIDRHLDERLPLTDLAQRAGCSSAHLSRLFRQHIGIPPGTYIIRRRMAMAQDLLAGTAESVQAIAERLCYSDPFAFSHAFQQQIGCSPSHWRAQYGSTRTRMPQREY